MKRSIFLKVLASALALPVVSAVTTAQVQAATTPAITPTTDAALEYMALDVAVTALNRFGSTRDATFWPFIYARLGEAGMDTSWPTAQKVGQRYYQLRDELITRANPLNPTGQK